MGTVVTYEDGRIVIRSEGLFEKLGLAGRVCTLDFALGTVEEVVTRLWWTTREEHGLREFDAVDYSHEFLSKNEEKFMVGLRFARTGRVFPLAAFLGVTFLRIGELFGSDPGPSHELEARSLANLLCQKLGLKLA